MPKLQLLARWTPRAWLLLQVSLIGAAVTMMAGVLSALAISLTPYLSNKVRADRRFTGDWLRKMIPVFVACALVVLGSGPIKRIPSAAVL